MTSEEEQRIARYHTKINFQRDEIRALRELVMKLQESKSLRAQYSTSKSKAWGRETGSPNVVSFWTDDGNCWGFIFHHLSVANYDFKLQTLLIDWPVGTILIRGPKVQEFYSDFAKGASWIKADGHDITSVTMILNADKPLPEKP
jgi:hypothetical protein